MKELNTLELKKMWFKFFEEKGYARIPSASLIPENDATVLFTTAGMHPLVPYLLGEKHPKGKYLMDVQKCVRTNDIDEVGDPFHCTFFEMLGNWSLGECDKKTMIKNSFDFLTSSECLGIDKDKLVVSVFAGDETAPKDVEAHDAWISAGMREDQIFYLPKENNWWALGGGVGPCGPDTEMFIDTGKPKCCDDCSPACDCGKYVEIWNDVFMQYNVKEQGQSAVKLDKPNIDTGLGVERTVCIINNVKSVYDVGSFKKVINYIEDNCEIKYKDTDDSTKAYRVIADHLRAATFIMSDGIAPATTGQGYVLRRLLRRSVNYANKIGLDRNKFKNIVNIYIDDFKDEYDNLNAKKLIIIEEIKKEVEKFEKTLLLGQKEFEKVVFYTKGDTLNGKTAFRLYDTFGFPVELTQEMALEKGLKVDIDGYHNAFKEHQEKSRAGAEQLFKGGLADTTDKSAKLHTATHLLLAALRKHFGSDIFQRGSNITPERLRFDFDFDHKMTPEEIKLLEDEVNLSIKKAVPVVCQEMTVQQAKDSGALGIFDSKYGEVVKVYSIEGIDKQICGGPHASNTSELGSFKIIKEESCASGIRRIKAIID